jgi:prolycopene isomerase
MGGLTAGATLAKAGLDVCVLERDSRPGGYLAGFRRKGFKFDTAIHWLNQCGPEGLVRRVFDYLGPGAPRTEPLRLIRRYKSASFDYLLTDHPDDLRDAFVRDFPTDSGGIHAFFDLARRLGEAIVRVGRNCRTPETMGPFEKARRGLKGAIDGMLFLRNSKPTKRSLPKFFQSEGLRNVFCSEENLLSCLVPIGWAYVGDFQQPPEGGSVAFPEWLTGLVEASNGTVAYRNAVAEVLLDGGRVRGVKLEGGDEIACKYVIAACDLHALYERMLPQGAIEARHLRRIEEADLYDSSVTLSLCLDAPAEELGFGEELVYLTRDGLTREEHIAHDPHKVGLSILAPSLRDPTLAPEGKGTLTVYAPARLDDGDTWRTGPDLERGEAYRKYKREYAEVLIDRVASAMSPGLADHIELCDVATPVTHYRYTGNRGGSIMAAKATGKNIRRRVARYRTPIENLYLGGHWAEYGGGVPVAVRAGVNSALLVLRAERPRAFDEVKTLLDAD